MAHYMAQTVLRLYYEEIKKAGSDENAVDHFWTNMSRYYFTVERNYGLELEQRRLEGIIKNRADFTIGCIRNGDYKKVVVFMESRKKGHETQISSWTSAVDRLTEYLKLVRAEQMDIGGDEGTLYGGVAIATYVRFYYLEPGDGGRLRDFPPAQETGQAYELKDDEEEIHKVLNEFVARTVK